MDPFWLLLRRMGVFFAILGVVTLMCGIVLMLVVGWTGSVPEDYESLGWGMFKGGLGSMVVGVVLLVGSYLPTPSKGGLTEFFYSSDETEKKR